jgi:hypothetical protein
LCLLAGHDYPLLWCQGMPRARQQRCRKPFFPILSVHAQGIISGDISAS